MLKNTEKARDYLELYLEKMSFFGFEDSEAVILLLNANDLTLKKLLKAVDYIEPPGTGEPREVSKQTAIKQIRKILK